MLPRNDPLASLPQWLALQFFPKALDSSNFGDSIWPDHQLRHRLEEYEKIAVMLQKAGFQLPARAVLAVFHATFELEGVLDPLVTVDTSFERLITRAGSLMRYLEGWGCEVNIIEDLPSLFNGDNYRLADWLHPTYMSHRVLRLLLELGLDPNILVDCGGHMVPPLFIALRNVVHWSTEVRAGNLVKFPEVPEFLEEHPIWTPVADLILAGADVRHAPVGVITPTYLALRYDVLDEWRDALEYCGFNADEVTAILNDDLPHPATSTSVDVGAIAVPPRRRLNCRVVSSCVDK